MRRSSTATNLNLGPDDKQSRRQTPVAVVRPTQPQKISETALKSRGAAPTSASSGDVFAWLRDPAVWNRV
jgi:hypothetical protein